MLLIDANLLIYAYHAESEDHAAAKEWLEATFSAADAVALPWQSIPAFLRITTHARVFQKPLAMRTARTIVATWLERPQVYISEPGARYFEVLSDLFDSAKIKGALVTDAALAALAIEHGATLCTTDGDFARFKGLKFLNPLRR